MCLANVIHNRDIFGSNLQHIASLWWVHGEDKQEYNAKLLCQHLDSLHKMGYVFVSYSVEAECRFLHAIGFDYRKLRWIDLWVEYQMLLNQNHKIAYGKQIIKGRQTVTRPPPPKRFRMEQGDEVDTGADSKNPPETGLVAATYKLLGVYRDSAHKTAMRDLIISGGPFSDDDKEAICQYCIEDTKDLPRIFDCILEEYQSKLSKADFSKMWEQMLKRGDYAMRSAQMVILGYPADIPMIRNLTENIPHLKHDLCTDVNAVIYAKYGFKPFRFNKNTHKFSKDMKAITVALTTEYPDWPVGDNKMASISEDVLKKYTSDRHNFKDTLPSQLSRVQQNDSAVRGFEKQRDARKRSFMEHVGPDGRVRPFNGIYRSQSSRSQPSASGFLFLKSAWVRRLVQPPMQDYIGSIDYSAQEFLVAACLSGDKAMMLDYASGDPYVAFGIRAGIIPVGGTKKTHKLLREICKSLCLAGDTLVRIKGKGWVPISSVLPGDMVWDGSAYRSCDGAVCNGVADTISVEGVSMTPDHLLRRFDDWQTADAYKMDGPTREAICEPSISWCEVWEMARYLWDHLPKTLWRAAKVLCRLY